jgi:hypothetical protein
MSIERNSGAPFVSDKPMGMAEPYREWFTQVGKSGMSRREKSPEISTYRAKKFAQECGWHLIEIGDQLILFTDGTVKIHA